MLSCIHPAGIYLRKVNKRNTRIRCEICSKLTITTTNFEQVIAGWEDICTICKYVIGK